MNTTKLKPLLTSSLLGFLTLAPAFSQSLAERERIRRENLIVEAEQHLIDGRAAYAEGDFEKAVREYRSAMEKTPQGSMTETRRKAIAEHLGDGSVALSQKYRQIGKYDEAREMLESVLLVDPTNQAALRQLDYLDDPIRTNPALTYEHTQNVDRVRRLLYLGEGYYNLGQFDKAEVEFNNVLKIDPYNKAARRWLERCAQIKADYYRSAYDETRARLLMEVDKAWEIAVATDLDNVGNGPTFGGGGNTGSTSSYITEKLKNIIIPTVDFEDISVEEAVDFLRMRSRELDNTEIDPSRKGVNFIVRGGGGGSELSSELLEDELGGGGGDPTTARISELKLTNVPLVQVLQFICDLAQLRYRVDEYAVTLLPLDSTDTSELITRQWVVTPTFISDLGGSSGGDSGGNDDPFAVDSGDSSSALAGSASVQELLASSGIDFNEGASASFIKATSTLIVKNTINNLDLVDAIVERVNNQTPKQIKILTKFVEVTQENTDELGFDWNLGTSTTNDINFNGGSQGNGQLKNDFALGNGRVLTSGIRTGDGAITRDSIDFLLNNSNRFTQTVLNGPGILSIGGIFSGRTIEMIFRGLSQKKGVDIMTAPSIVARSGETAKIEVIRELIYPTEYEPPEVPDTVESVGVFPVTPATPTAFETRPTGVILEIAPQTGEENDYVINLDFAPEIVEFEGFVNYGSPITGADLDGDSVIITENRIEMPIFSIRRVKSQLTIYDGHTIAVGGLMREDIQNVEDKVPILGDIPLIGRLFESKAENRIKSNLIIFVTAQVIDATGKPIRGANPDFTEVAGTGDFFEGDSILPPPIN